ILYPKITYKTKTQIKMKIILSSILLLIISSTYSQTRITMNKEGGIYTVPCKINGLPLKFIFDTGASDVSISLTEAMFMLKNGYLKKDDIGESVYYSIANGDVAKGTKINIREVEFGGLKLYNISASIVHETSAPLLLGQSVIEKLGKIQIDGSELTIINKGNNYYNYSENNNSYQERTYTYQPVVEIVEKKMSETDYNGFTPILSEPTLNKSKCIGYYNKEFIKVLSKYNIDFYKVEYNSGKVVGYVHKNLIEK
ncbi:TPA: retropepsin-like aspartic protease family protein, partial [Flavobacterium psychrophilum]